MTPQEFERDVRELLHLQGWRVTPEKLLGYKKVDAYAEKPDSLGGTVRLAVECKDWASPITQQELTTIYLNYHPLIESNQVDTLLLVTRNGITPSAATYITTSRFVRHLTHRDLLNTLIDFRGHLRGLISSFKDDAVSSEYIPQDYDEGEGTLEEFLMRWASAAPDDSLGEHEQSKKNPPVAILGGYGIGKTTLTKRLGFLFAERCMIDSTSRIPIVLQLSTIASDQTLEGLLGRQFTSVTICHNYNFQLFRNLNARGRFIIFLDGFDEMKRTMSWETLLYNLTQLNTLVTAKSKIVLLGRPSAFLTDDEHQEALHGRARRATGAWSNVPGWPDYRELHIKPFGRQHVVSFLQTHLSHLPTNTQAELDHRHRVLKYLDNVESPQGKQLVDLASRPVQLRMLTELLPDYHGPLDKMTVAILYQEFIDFILRREANKPARLAFTKEQRKRFAGRLAYWMWCDDQRSETDVARITESLFDGYLDRQGIDAQPSDIKRDLLSGAFLERKPPNLFFFPHRSFQEFLVADELANLCITNDNSIAQCPFLTPEITSFFAELIGKSGAIRLRNSWNRREISENLRDLINTACVHHGISMVESPPEALSSSVIAAEHTVTAGERQKLLRKLDLVGVVTTKGEDSDDKRSKITKPHVNLHRKGGVTPKHRYHRQ